MEGNEFEADLLGEEAIKLACDALAKSVLILVVHALV